MTAQQESSWEKLCDGPHGEVWILDKCTKSLDKLRQERLRAKAFANMSKRFCILEDLSDLAPSQFVLNEGRQKIGQADVMLSVFKGGDLRIYGFLGSVEGERAFFATHAVVKKANKLNAKDAKLATERLIEAIKFLPGASV